MIANEGRRASAEFAIIISYLANASGIIVSFKKNQDILPDLADFAFQEQAKDNLMVVIFRAWPLKANQIPGIVVKQ